MDSINQQYYQDMAENNFPTRPSASAVQSVRNFVDGKEDALRTCTFEHIVEFLDTGAEHSRLQVAAADFGLSIETVRGFRIKKIPAKKVAAAVVALYS